MSDTTTELAASDSTQPPTHSRARRVLALMLFLILLLFGISGYLLYRSTVVPKAAGEKAVADTSGLMWVRSIYGLSDKTKDLFGQTVAAVPGAGGDIWVTDIYHPASISRFSADGRYLGTLASKEPSSPITTASRFAVGPDGKIYIAQTASDKILVLTPDGREAGSFGIPKPVSVAVGADRIAVGAVAGFAIVDKSGKPIGVVGSRGKGPDQFDYVHGIAFGDDGSIYVTDSYNNRLRAYEPDGKPRWVIRTGAPANGAKLTNNMLTSKAPTSTALTGNDQLQLPLGLTIDGAGRVVVIDMFDSSISVFNPKDGKFIAKYGDYGADDGQFFYPVSIGYDKSRDWFTIADAMNKRVQIVRIPGSASGATGLASLANRAFSGPLRACLIPLLLLLLGIVIYVIWRAFQRRRGDRESVVADAEPDLRG